MSYIDQFEMIKNILVNEGRWTPKAFEKFGVTCEGRVLRIPFWGNSFVDYDFSISDSEVRKRTASKNRPAGKKAVLFGNLEKLDSPILLTEGEWDLFAAYEAGFDSIATPSNGAGSVSDRMARELADREVHIAFDNDDAGRKGALKAAEALKKQNCSVKLLDLGEHVEEKGDIRDYFNGGKSKEDFLKLIKATPYFLNDLESKVHANVNNVLSLCNIQEKEIDWCIKDLVPTGAVTLLTGDPGSGKSTLAAHIISVASNGGYLYDPPFGPYLREQPVIVFSVEDPPEQVFKPRLMKFSAKQENVFVYPHILVLDEVGQATIKEVAKKYKPGLIIIDPIVAYLGGKMDTSKANEVREKMSFFMKVAEEYRLAILIIRHMGKGSQNGGKLLYSGHGSIDFTASVRSELMLIKHPKDENLRLFGQVKNNFGRLTSALTVDFSTGTPKFLQNTNRQTLEQLLQTITFEETTSHNRVMNHDTKAAILKMLKSRPMLSNVFQEELAEAGYKSRTAIRIIREDLKDKVGRERISFPTAKAGKGVWLTGLVEHLKIMQKQKLKCEAEVIEFIGSHDFPSIFQDCQENED